MPERARTVTWRGAAVVFLAVSAITLGAMAVLDRPALQTGDNKGTIFPLVLESWRQVRAGRLPEWSDLCWAGTPLVGNGAVGALYAPYAPGFALTPAPHLRAFDVAAALHAGWFAAGAVLLLGALGLSPALALAGVCLALLARFANWTAFAFIAAYVALSWWPWVLLAAERLARRPAAAGAVLLGTVALSAQVIAGFPEHAFSAGVAAAVWILVRGRALPLGRRLGCILLLAIGSAALSAPAILPTLVQMREAGFFDAKPFPGLAALVPVTLGRLIDVRTTAAPAGPLTLGFVGLVTAALAIVGAGRAPLLAAFFVFALLMALGDHTPWYPAVRSLPGFSLSRNPIKFVAFVEVLAAWLAAFGLDRIRDGGGRGREGLAWGLLALAIAERGFAQGMALPIYAGMSGGPNSVAAVRAGLAEGGVVSRMSETSPPTKVIDGVPIRPDLNGLLLNCVPAIDHVATFHGGMLNLVAARHLRLNVTVTRPALRLFGIDAAVGYGDEQCTKAGAHWNVQGGDESNPICVLWTPDPRPTYEVVGDVIPVASDDQMLAKVRQARGEAVPILAPPDALAGVRTPHAPGTVAVRSYRAGAIDLHAIAHDPAVLVLRHKWHPGWAAEVDGVPAPLWRAIGLYMAIPLPPGAHDVRVRYHEPGLRVGLAIAASWLALAGVLAVRERRHAPPDHAGRGLTSS